MSVKMAMRCFPHIYINLGMYAQLSSGDRSLNLGPSIYLRPSFVFTSSVGSDETVQMHMLA